MIQVIVNADDYGMDENRTKAILRAYEEGWISTTTAMVNMPWFDKSLELAEGSRLFDSIGLHLNLTEGVPLTDPIKRSPLFCDANGRFNAAFHHTKRYRLFLPEFECNAVKEETAAQFERYCRSGLKSFHLDSHHHVHTDWSIAGIVLPLAAKYGFKRVRISRNFGGGLTFPKRIYKYFLNRKLRKELEPVSDYFCNYEDFEKNWKVLPGQCRVEIMTHPLFSINHEADLNGELTEFHWDRSSRRNFWKNPPEGIRLYDHNGSLK